MVAVALNSLSRAVDECTATWLVTVLVTASSNNFADTVQTITKISHRQPRAIAVEISSVEESWISSACPTALLAGEFSRHSRNLIADRIADTIKPRWSGESVSSRRSGTPVPASLRGGNPGWCVQSALCGVLRAGGGLAVTTAPVCVCGADMRRSRTVFCVFRFWLGCRRGCGAPGANNKEPKVVWDLRGP
jgi:hypothetical protein